mmetsp:Transcript_28489/g.59899  ORF Transcript_28489/g.59899 Transcript_28489/m.59899 type:complete len:225 (+) Transcript_28489:274-948(+)
MKIFLDLPCQKFTATTKHRCNLHTRSKSSTRRNLNLSKLPLSAKALLRCKIQQFLKCYSSFALPIRLSPNRYEFLLIEFQSNRITALGQSFQIQLAISIIIRNEILLNVFYLRCQRFMQTCVVAEWEGTIIAFHYAIRALICIQKQELMANYIDNVSNIHIFGSVRCSISMLHRLTSKKAPSHDSTVLNRRLANGNGIIFHEELNNEAAVSIVRFITNQLGIEA